MTKSVETLETSRNEKKISFLSRALDLLAAARTIEDVKHIHDQAEAARAYARAAAMGLDTQNRAAEIKLRAERKAGCLLARAKLRGGHRSRDSDHAALKLSDLGITKDQSYRWQCEASVPEDVFEKYVQRCLQGKQEITSAALLRLARSGSHPYEARRYERTVSEVSRVNSQLGAVVADGKRFGCIYVKPRWPAESSKTAVSSAAALCSKLGRLPVENVAAEKSHLHLQTPLHLIAEGIRLLQKWGFLQKNALLIAYQRPSFGPYWRTNQQLLLLGVKGGLTFRDSDALGWIDTSPNCCESDVMRKLVRVSRGPFLSVFARDRQAEWTAIP